MNKKHSLRVLFVTSEIQPLMKTGGLADVSASLPASLRALGHDVRILTPAYADTLQSGFATRALHHFLAPAGSHMRLLETALPENDLPVWLVDVPEFSGRPGSPYHDAHGKPYADNARRFNILCRVGAWIAADAAGLSWRPDIVHCNEWHTGLLPVWMYLSGVPVASVFTIHNLAYQGLFSRDDFDALHLPDWLWHMHALEFHGQLSFIKGGLQFSERLTTVSPTFAREILTPSGGAGLDGVLRERAAALTGILNGLDISTWNPQTDPYLESTYSAASLEQKALNTHAIRKQMNLADARGQPLVAVIGRLVFQKGIDYLLKALPELMRLPLQLAVIGSGERAYEQQLKKSAKKFPGQLAVHTGFDEALAHRLEAGAQMLLMPSRYEPCGLTQLQSLRYGTVPVVGRCGGLVDTVVECNAANLKSGTATGFFINSLSPAGIVSTMQKVLRCYTQTQPWLELMKYGMRQDFSWERSALAYEAVYRDALKARRGGPQRPANMPLDSTPPGGPQG